MGIWRQLALRSLSAGTKIQDFHIALLTGNKEGIFAMVKRGPRFYTAPLRQAGFDSQFTLVTEWVTFQV